MRAAHREPHHHGDRHRRQNCKQTPRALRQRVHHHERQHRERGEDSDLCAPHAGAGSRTAAHSAPTFIGCAASCFSTAAAEAEGGVAGAAVVGVTAGDEQIVRQPVDVFERGGRHLLARLVGEKRAREIWYLCRRYTAKEALDMGMVNAVVPADKLDALISLIGDVPAVVPQTLTYTPGSQTWKLSAFIYHPPIS